MKPSISIEMKDLIRPFKKIKSSINDLIGFYSKIRMHYSNTSILESLGEYKQNTSRYSIIGVIAAEKLVCHKDKGRLYNLKTEEVKKANWLEVMDSWINVTSANTIDTPFQPGAIGYIGYDMKFCFEELQHTIEKDHDVPDVYLVRYSVLLVNDKKTGETHWILDKDEDEGIIDEILMKIERFSHERLPFSMLGDIKTNFDKDQYLDHINRNIEYIRNGDIFQANITMRFQGKYQGDVFPLYMKLRENTPNPFFCMFDFDYPLISTSPERFFKIENQHIYSNPIKGTIRCTIDGEDQYDTLASSIKDKAENTMIVDLMRNDIGRFCYQHTVEVTDLCGIRKFNDIYHLESIVEGKVIEDTKFSEILKATFPGGSITGTPKIRSMDIIEELEFTRRGPYCGAIGFFGQQGYVDTSIAIRIVYFDKDRIYFHAGGGIVNDSIAESEFVELMLKIESIKNTLTNFNLLNDFRYRIDSCDKKLLEVLHERFSIVKEVGVIKNKHSIPLMQKERVVNLVNNKKELAKQHGIISEDFVEKLYYLLIDEAMRMEELENSENDILMA